MACLEIYRLPHVNTCLYKDKSSPKIQRASDVKRWRKIVRTSFLSAPFLFKCGLNREFKWSLIFPFIIGYLLMLRKNVNFAKCNGRRCFLLIFAINCGKIDISVFLGI